MIEVRNITKRYGQHLAVDNISFTVNAGEIVGFLGPNGAGKTTTMNIITGFISATEGDVSVYGKDILKEPEEAKKHIGYMPDNPPLYQEMTVNEYLSFVCDLKKVPGADRKKMLKHIMGTVGISEMGGRLCKNLSKGYRQRVGLAQALVGYPGVIIMDEPTVGLDPKQIIEMRQVIKSLGKSHTLILSSHILNEVAAVCGRVIIINRGRLAASENTAALSLESPHWNRVLVRIRGDKTKVSESLTKSGRFDTVTRTLSREPMTFDYEITGAEGRDIREDIFNVLAGGGHPIYLMKSMEPTLEELFLRVTAGERGID